MSIRVTTECLAAGQPRAYADTILRVRVTIESRWAEDRDWAPSKLFKEPEVRELLRHLKVGFTASQPENWASTRLEYLREISEGVWEFQTRSPYTD